MNKENARKVDRPQAMEILDNYFVETPEPLRETLTIQIVLARNIVDYTVLRTEETRELNTVATPLSKENLDAALRVVFLGGKQKAAETRKLGDILRTANRLVGRNNVQNCYLKDKLCMHCPRCALFGAMTVKGGSQEMNFKHRIEYSSAFSLLPYEDVVESITFNAIDDVTTKVGQALGETPSVSPANVFPSIITLNTITWKELLLTIKTILATKSYGAEGRTKGDAYNAILGLAAGWEEIITPLELTLELYDDYEKVQSIDSKLIYSVLDSYKRKCAFVNQVTVLSPEEVANLCTAIQEFDLSREFLDSAYEDVETYLSKANLLDRQEQVKPKVKAASDRKQ